MRNAALVLLSALLLCSCSHDQTAPSPHPATAGPTVPASPSADPAKDPLYLEAVGVYRRYFAEMAKLEAAGYPSDTLPPVMDRYITGGMKKAVQNSIVEARRQHLAPAPGAASRLSAIAPVVGVRREDALVGIRICADGREADVVDSRTGKVVGKGVLNYKEIYFKRFDGVLKGYLSDSRKVDSCPI